MKYYIAFLFVAIIFSIIEWIFKETNFHNKLISTTIGHYKYFKLILFSTLIMWGFFTEALIYFFNERFSQQYYVSLILRAVSYSILYEFIVLFFKKSKGGHRGA